MPKNEDRIITATTDEKSRVLVNTLIKLNNRRKGSKYIKPSYGSGGGSYNDASLKKISKRVKDSLATV